MKWGADNKIVDSIPIKVARSYRLPESFAKLIAGQSNVVVSGPFGKAVATNANPPPQFSRLRSPNSIIIPSVGGLQKKFPYEEEWIRVQGINSLNRSKFVPLAIEVPDRSWQWGSELSA